MGISGMSLNRNQFFLPKIHANRSFHKNFMEMKKQAILD
jgi:hypothetical protein